ncbi:unnamed protein product [Triticum turgidum subsp. durum]|uniref:Glutathione S-transferase n=1 Tax=Triticum turgidum subsp. durum TaxID=4567 RepID=A0A9R0QXR5_TRITD|nr:unnamed protein product [Triticum turgidum subsp. durum]
MADTGDELKLLGMWASPYVVRVQLALRLKGVSYEYVEEDLANKSELFLRSNPVRKTVPVLIHNGKPVCESQRAVARFWAAYVEDKLLAPWGKVFRVTTDEERAEWTRQTVAAVGHLEEGLRECSKGKGFFGGDCVGYVDVLLGSMVPWVRATERLSADKLIDAGRAPLLAAWMERISELDAAKAVFQDVDRVVEYAGGIQARLSAAAASTQ